MTPVARRATDLLERVLARLAHAEQRDGQTEMVAHVADAIDAGTPLVIQAGTGTGKTLGYLVPVIAAGQTAVIATYTKALQDQLASVDLPHLQQACADDDLAFTWAVLKGRNNYLCRQRVSEIETGADELDLGDASQRVAKEVKKLVAWSNTTPTGEISDVPFAVSDTAWSKVSLGSDECPGAVKCEFGATCFTELARERADTANVVVVNFTLYGLDLEHDREFLPAHDVVVFDEVHELEDVISDTASVTLTPRVIANAAETARKAVTSQKTVNALAKTAKQFDEVLERHKDRRFAKSLPDDLRGVLDQLATQVGLIGEGLRNHPDEDAEHLRATKVIERLEADLAQLSSWSSNTVAFVTSPRGNSRLTAAPKRVDGTLAPVWSDTTAILTSATIPPGLPQRLGLAVDDDAVVRVASPFDYSANSLLYLADDLPVPNASNRATAVSTRIRRLIELSDGSALVLFTSWTALRDAVGALRGNLGNHITLYSQEDMPKKQLLDAFRNEEKSCLFATRGFFQGVDVPGDSLRLVVIDKVPFPQIGDPLLEARREDAGAAAFMSIDVPIASATLAQAAGRLIRTASDHGVVAVLDPRLATKGYKSAVLAGVAHMPETSSLRDVERFYDKRR
jgi:ATP-dependent DNA helicase DinG